MMSCLVDLVPSWSLSISWISEPWLYLYGGLVSDSTTDMDLMSTLSPTFRAGSLLSLDFMYLP